MDLNKLLLIKFLSAMTGEGFASVKKTLKGVTTEEEYSNGIQSYKYNDSYICVSESRDLAVIYNLKNQDNYKYNYVIRTSVGSTYYRDGTGPYQAHFYNYGDNFNNVHDLSDSINKILNCNLFESMDCWESFSILTALLKECSIYYCADNCENFYIEDTETLFNDCYCVPESISSYIDYERFENDLTYDNYISLGGRVLYYGC